MGQAAVRRMDDIAVRPARQEVVVTKLQNEAPSNTSVNKHTLPQPDVKSTTGTAESSVVASVKQRGAAENKLK